MLLVHCVASALCCYCTVLLVHCVASALCCYCTVLLLHCVAIALCCYCTVLLRDSAARWCLLCCSQCNLTVRLRWVASFLLPRCVTSILLFFLWFYGYCLASSRSISSLRIHPCDEMQFRMKCHVYARQQGARRPPAGCQAHRRPRSRLAGNEDARHRRWGRKPEPAITAGECLGELWSVYR
jgi:hypothetical protein